MQVGCRHFLYLAADDNVPCRGRRSIGNLAEKASFLSCAAADSWLKGSHDMSEVI